MLQVLGVLQVLGASFVIVASAGAQSVTGTITTTAKGVAPVRVTIDQKVCGNELPDEAIVVDAKGRLANAVVDPDRCETRRGGPRGHE